jgi:hypothetical protein
MATKERGGRDLQKVNTPEGLPDYLATLATGDHSLEDLRQERTLSRIKVIHGSSSPELKKIFDEGDVIISPGQTLIAKVIKAEQSSESFFMVPLMFFVEFCKWKDLNDTGSPTILARSFDKGSDIAAKAKNFQKRDEPYGDGFTARYVEHLNFVSVIVGYHPLANQMEPFILGFCKGEWGVGKNFITTLARMSAPLWSTVWKFNSCARSKGSYNWWGIDFLVPNQEKDGIGRFITQDQVEIFHAAHEELRKLHSEHRLVVDRSDIDDVNADTADDGKPSEF